MYSFATGTKFTGSTLAPAPSYADSVIYGYANAMQTTHSGRQINTAKTATTTEKSERKTLLDALDENANYLESMANKAAVGAGDVNAGYSLITAVGFQVAGKGTAKRIIGFVNAGIGWAHAHEAKTVKGVEGHIWEGGTHFWQRSSFNKCKILVYAGSRYYFQRYCQRNCFCLSSCKRYSFRA